MTSLSRLSRFGALAYFACGALAGFAASSLLLLTTFDLSCLEHDYNYLSSSTQTPQILIQQQLLPYRKTTTTTTSHIRYSQQDQSTMLTHQRYNKNDNHYVNNDNNNGWKTIHVFYGNRSHIASSSAIPNNYFAANEWFSQYRQDEVIATLFQNKNNILQRGDEQNNGFYFVDLAANDAVRISNTFALETFHGWNGLCLEPNPIYWNGLSYRKCTVAGVVVGRTSNKEVVFKFPQAKGPKGGIVGSEFDNKASTNNNNNQKGEVPRVTLSLLDIFEYFRVPKVIDYLSLDVEGAEEFIMGAFPFEHYKFHVLTIERPNEQLTRLLEHNGYILVTYLKRGKETLWIHESMQDKLDIENALKIDTDNYKYRENHGERRKLPSANKS